MTLHHIQPIHTYLQVWVWHWIDLVGRCQL